MLRASAGSDIFSAFESRDPVQLAPTYYHNDEACPALGLLMAKAESLNPYERPPSFIKNVYKFYQKLPRNAIEFDPEILDFNSGCSFNGRNAVVKLNKLSRSAVVAACYCLRQEEAWNSGTSDQDVQVYEARDIPGLLIVPGLIPKEYQGDLLSRLLHRDLADPRHRTNVHSHHELPYHTTVSKVPVTSHLEAGYRQISFFNLSPKSSEPFLPIDDNVHKSFTVGQFLNRKLRWVTLGGQYDWTQKRYPPENPPFPADIADFARVLFPEMKAEAAIVNVYTPGDTLSIHRDVSEESDKGLVSISLGCEGIFVVGLDPKNDENTKSIVVRLRSGDAVFMSKAARFAWHGVPQILPDTCPEWLCSWPATMNAGDVDPDRGDPFEAWRDWMSNKRINLNIRQMSD